MTNPLNEELFDFKIRQSLPVCVCVCVRFHTNCPMKDICQNVRQNKSNICTAVNLYRCTSVSLYICSAVHLPLLSAVTACYMLNFICSGCCCSVLSVSTCPLPTRHVQHSAICTVSNTPPVAILTAYFYLKKVFLKLQRQFSFGIKILVTSGYNVPLKYYSIYKFCMKIRQN